MNSGKMLQIGKAEELYNTPRELFVATFIGSPPMNIIPCEYMVKGDKVILKHSTFELLWKKNYLKYDNDLCNT
jgi:ABC-type sugar transport system ATPase subunit